MPVFLTKRWETGKQKHPFFNIFIFTPRTIGSSINSDPVFLRLVLAFAIKKLTAALLLVDLSQIVIAPKSKYFYCSSDNATILKIWSLNSRRPYFFYTLVLHIHVYQRYVLYCKVASIVLILQKF